MLRLRSACAIWILAATPAAAPAQFVNGQAAFRVLGQPDFRDFYVGQGATSMTLPSALALDLPHAKLYVADSGSNRVLRFAWPVAADAPAAEVVFGQTGFGSCSGNSGDPGATTMFDPQAIAVDTNGTLYVADTNNHRVLEFPAAHLATAHGTSASRVLGQPRFTTRDQDATTTGMNFPRGLAWEAPDRLWVADGAANRVLRFDNVSRDADGASADGVLGQRDFTTTTPGAGATKFDSVWGLAVHGGTLFVASVGSHRIMRFDNAAAKADGAAADGVFGQADLAGTGFGTIAARLRHPAGVATDVTGRLYAADFFNHRVLVYGDAVAGPDGANAAFVLGQSDFVRRQSGQTDRDLNRPQGVAVDSVNGIVAVADTQNNRVVLYRATGPVSSTAVTKADH